MTSTLMELRALRLHLEADLERLREQLGVVDDELAELRTAHRRGALRDVNLSDLENAVLELRREIQRRKIALAEIEEQIITAEADDLQNHLSKLSQRNDQTKAELDLLRRELLKALLGMSELLRRHERTAAEKLRVTAELAKLDGKNYAYENYIACALLHKQDYSGDVQFVVDRLKKIRPVT